MPAATSCLLNQLQKPAPPPKRLHCKALTLLHKVNGIFKETHKYFVNFSVMIVIYAYHSACFCKNTAFNRKPIAIKIKNTNRRKQKQICFKKSTTIRFLDLNKKLTYN